MARYDQCTDDCTTDCGHCKGAGKPDQDPNLAGKTESEMEFERTAWDEDFYVELKRAWDEHVDSTPPYMD